MYTSISYGRCQELFSGLRGWRSVPHQCAQITSRGSLTVRATGGFATLLLPKQGVSPPVPANHPTECLPTAGYRRPLPRVPPAPSYQPRFARPSQRSLDSLRSSASASSLCTKWNVGVGTLASTSNLGLDLYATRPMASRCSARPGCRPSRCACIHNGGRPRL